jgi:hypothetical protein
LLLSIEAVKQPSASINPEIKKGLKLAIIISGLKLSEFVNKILIISLKL